MKSKIVIGDVHGCYDTLMKLMDQLPHDNVVFCGDLVDRGEKSREVVTFVKENNYDCVLGNHEELMIEADGQVFTPSSGPYGDTYLTLWGNNGGYMTLLSYKDHYDLVFEHIQWMKTLPYYLEYPDIKNDAGLHLLVTHACATKDAWANKDKDELLWSREFSDLEPLDNIFSVFGHTPQPHGFRKTNHYACIDTGCVYKDRPAFGRLTAIEYPSLRVYEQLSVEKL